MGIWPRSQKVALHPKLHSLRSVVCPTMNILVGPTTSAALASGWILNKISISLFELQSPNTSKPTYYNC